jgi:N-acetylmuramoyl-L-alanine amidase
MIFISAGHHLKDSGAIAPGGRQENKTTIEFRDLVVNFLNRKGAKFVKDFDTETLAEYLKRIDTGSGSVVLEFHFDAANTKASGCTAIVGTDAQANDKAFATEIAAITSSSLSIRNRGVINEADSHRGRLGLMREQGAVCLLELAFIDNAKDMIQYDANKNYLAEKIADILVKYENLI